MSLATVLTTVAWASSTATFCSRIRCNWARASGDVTGRWALTALNFAAPAGETLSVRTLSSNSTGAGDRLPRPCAGHDVRRFDITAAVL